MFFLYFGKSNLFLFILKELAIERSYLISILYEIILSENQRAKLNLIENYIELIEKDEKKENTLNNFGSWINLLYNQSSS